MSEQLTNRLPSPQDVNQDLLDFQRKATSKRRRSYQQVNSILAEKPKKNAKSHQHESVQSDQEASLNTNDDKKIIMTSKKSLNQNLPTLTPKPQNSLNSQNSISFNSKRSQVNNNTVSKQNSFSNKQNSIAQSVTKKQTKVSAFGSVLRKNSGKLSQTQAPVTSDIKARHAKLMGQVMKEQSTLKQKTQKYKKKNTIIKKTEGMFGNRFSIKTIIKQKTIRKGDDELDSKNNEDNEVEIYSQFQQSSSAIIPSQGVISPDSLFKTFWDTFMFLLIVWQTVVVPYRLCFDITEGSAFMSGLDTAVDVFFILDILLSFDTGIYDKGILIMNRQSLIKLYLKTWFVIDLLATFPWSYLINVQSTDQSNSSILAKTPQLLRLLKMFRFLRFLKLLRILKVSKVLVKYEDLLYNASVNMVMSMLKLLVIIVFFAHILACLFFVVGNQQNEVRTWLKVQGLQDEDSFTQYICSLYWAFTTMVTVGYGDISATNTDERMFTMVAMIISAGVYTFTINTIGKKVSEYNLLASQFRESMLYVGQWMVNNDLRKDLRVQIRRYLEYQWNLKQEMKIEEKDVMSLLNQDLKDKIIMHMNGKYIQYLTFKDEFSMEFISQIVFKMQEETFGVAENIILKKDYFGEIAFFTEEQRTTSIKSRDFTDLIYIDRESFMEVADDYVEALDAFHKIKLAIVEQRNYQFLKISCFICKKQGHIAIQCPYFYVRRGNLNLMVKHYEKSQKSIFSSPNKNENESFSDLNLQILIKRNEKNESNLKNTLQSREASFSDESDMVRAYTKAAGGVISEESSMQTDSDYDHKLTNSARRDSEIDNFSDTEMKKCSESKEQEYDENVKRNIPISFFKIVNLDDDRHIKITATASPEEIAKALRQQKTNLKFEVSENSEESSDGYGEEEEEGQTIFGNLKIPYKQLNGSKDVIMEEEEGQYFSQNTKRKTSSDLVQTVQTPFISKITDNKRKTLDEAKINIQDDNGLNDNERESHSDRDSVSDASGNDDDKSRIQEANSIDDQNQCQFEFDQQSYHEQNGEESPYYTKYQSIPSVNSQQSSIKKAESGNESEQEESFNFKDSVERNNYFNMLEKEVFEQMQNEFNSIEYSEGSLNNISTSNPMCLPHNQSDAPSIDTVQENFLIREYEKQQLLDQSSFDMRYSNQASFIYEGQSREIDISKDQSLIAEQVFLENESSYLQEDSPTKQLEMLTFSKDINQQQQQSFNSEQYQQDN